MTLKEAIKICKEMQKWRRAEPPYDFVTPNLMPYTAKEYGEALDKLIEYAEEEALARACVRWVKKMDEQLVGHAVNVEG